MATKTLTGVIVDVSGSMEENAVGSREEEGEYVRSTFQVIDDVIKHDVSSDNHVFAIGVGGTSQSGVFDMLRAIQLTNELQDDTSPATSDQIEQIYRILEQSGAINVRRWADPERVKPFLTYKKADHIYRHLKNDRDFAKTFVYECLPLVCRDLGNDTIKDVPLVGRFFSDILNVSQTVATSAVTGVGITATDSSIENTVQNGIKMIMLIGVDKKSIFDVQAAASILRATTMEKELTSKRRKEILKKVKPFIYGRTPMFSALNSALTLFENKVDSKKVLVILSDGEPTERGDLYDVSRNLRSLQVDVVCCFIHRGSRISPKRLFCSTENSWEGGARFLFELSLHVPSNLMPRAILLKNGWDLELEKNETKLFVHVNHPDHIEDFCRVAKNTICCQEYLSDLLVTIAVDIYINQSTTALSAKEQVGGTCYANASAAAIHMATKRIHGREGGYPEFTTLRQEMITAHGNMGANTFRVLQTMCPRYRLRCHEISSQGALEAVVAKRIVVAKFRLTDRERDIFDDFYERQPTGILTRAIIDVRHRSPSEIPSGHAVVLISYNSRCLILMNSWGDHWGDMGFFRVESADVLGLEFMDVYWIEADLTENEKASYRYHGPEVARKLMSMLKGLQVQTYTCPLCARSPLVTEYTGTLSNAKCPRCYGEFPCSEAGNILAMNMYLTSLSRTD
ncbi:hypothetical protein MAR_034499 [Mya arenaria]|uniref:VWFA domain-containing protein n=1 Tax=Mya arenaria TaxID=6604 RepID=A0ABY7GC32_MYAAR|nr:uncharacterized protein LOC128223103 [Mya arenaria]XP_052788318.1 uncharacterized protein LOC128223103 [Mya arenaria]XP_052788319.1 uncharacterized protein LOC128223103 [Mya arenaria]WAR31957.1 hypothetical protein MAR_034499 [Mya arenaria]